ncbi:MAG: oligoendopeptidase F, partial [Clostridiales bacterium]|nr:oligoendopeptidase F [Clostridiales bacterium]
YIAEEQGLEMFRFMLTELLKNSAHTLTADQEMVIASYSEVLRAPGDVFSALNILDLDFGTIRDAGGNEVRLTPASYIHHMESSSREVRKAAYTALYNEYKAHNNTMAAIYSANVRKDAVTARLRRYSSSLQAALAPDSIPESVYDNLVSAVREHLPSMHRYVRARKKLLGLDKMYMYDIYNPLFAPDNTSYSFEEAVELISKALAPMGEEYVSVLRRGLTEERWADVYENTGKTSGAYSYGSYDSRPYILMNYGGGLRDVLTLIHESGHSMHSYYTRQTQPYIYGGHSIFTAEVASTVNETLLLRYLLENTEEPETEAYLINLYIDQFKGTLFRQTMFAEFERSAHEYVEAGEPLTAEWLNTEYGKLNAEYFGDSIEHDNLIQYEWSRIPHFYRSYYVYQYATGFSAANAIAGRLLGGEPDASADYIRFLRSGSSDTPVRLLQLAGADMSSAGPVGQALKVFDSLTERLAEIAGKK